MADESPQSSLLGKIAAYTEILEKDPNSTIFVSLGEAYRKLGCLDDAREIIDVGLKRHADFSPGYVVLARILCQQSLYDESSSAFSKALEFDENSLAGLVGFARLSLLREDVEQARGLLLKARSLSPADPVINKLLNSLPPQPDETEEKEMQDESVFVPLVTETLADLYLKQGLPDKALEIFRELLRNDPANLELRRRIRDAETLLQGGVEQAVSTFQPDVIKEALAEEEQEAAVEEPQVIDQETEEGVVELAPSFDDAVMVSRVEASDETGQVKAAKPLDILNQWLENIQKRRSNV